jgi:hypothetical protein
MSLEIHRKGLKKGINLDVEHVYCTGVRSVEMQSTLSWSEVQQVERSFSWV